MYLYILETDRSITATDDVLKWVIWFADATATGERIVKRTELGGYIVLTVFLGVSLGHSDDIPLTFLSSVLHGSASLETRLYVTQDEAEAGHERLVAKCRKFLGVGYVSG